MPDNKKFTAVVFFHGIGQQSRYEALSRILESFDDYSVVQNDDRLERIKVKVEASRSDVRDKNIGYATLERAGSEIRFYEVYWAPLTGSGTTARSIIQWFFGLVRTPIRILNSHWSSRRRLRVSYLYALWDKKYRKGSEFIGLRDLINDYNDWCDNVLRAEQADGSFDDFMSYLDQRDDDPATKKSQKSLARDWYRYTRRVEWRNDFVFFTLTYIMVILPLLTLGRVIYLLTNNIANGNVTLLDLLAFISPFVDSPLTWQMISRDPASYIFYGLLLIAVPASFIVSSMLRQYAGDVQLWSTYQETNEKYLKRKAILKRGLETLTHVLQHEDCERVLIVAHSLGSTIAYDTLLSIGRHNRAVQQDAGQQPRKLKLTAQTSLSPGMPSAEVLTESGDKIRVDHIEYFVTLGSPIDKIHYFFESKQGLFRPYELIVDDIRGDISVPPFVNDNGIPNFRWINFWSQEDYISSALYTPNARTFKMNEHTVVNVPVQSFEFPSPGRSHLGYFKHDTVIGLLYRLVFRDSVTGSSRVLNDAIETARSHTLSKQRFRDGMLLLSWSLLLVIVCDMFAYLDNPVIDALRTLSVYTFIGFCGLLVGTIMLSFGSGHVKKFEKDPTLSE